MALTVVPIVPVSEAWRSLPELYSPECPECVFSEVRKGGCLVTAVSWYTDNS
jgi:hypothetical protein